MSSFLTQHFDGGERVEVTGACLDQFHTRASAGPPPVARSDWQLTSGEHVVYVVGQQPGECASGPVTIVATVRLDTISVLGSSHVRRYLLLSRK